ncbi:hypothetical protein T8T21_17125 (plasmid) [Limimaricola variabilis]|uniref:hypothetical protein n=1 Tax=Limimaricola variabilis TaxID=1492771 RepID=UPI002AC99FB5|nr:hypothetical protein [Limimaricola variabilis]WPY96230.1 hypothetical protein T8T21_17125 [Limimaricola variabilis]
MTDLADIHIAMQVMLVIWVLLVVQITRACRARGSVGLPAALVLAMSFLYGGCFIYAVPGYSHLRPGAHWYLSKYAVSEWLIVQATFVSLLGLLGFAIGAGAFRRRPVVLVTTRPPQVPTGMTTKYERGVLVAMGTFALIGYLGNWLRLSFPLSAALFEAGRNMGVAVICLGAWLALRDGRSTTSWKILAAMIPAYYLVLFGFASYGFMFGVTLFCFWRAQVRPRRATSTLMGTTWAVGSVWLILTGFIGWFSYRDEIRQVVWEGTGGSLTSILWQAVSQIELFSPWNFEALDLVNIRLNLNLFVAHMIEQHQLFPELQQYGATLVILPLALLPRFLWPDKPVRGGSDFMSEHTGLLLSDSATFGSGTVFEFYINFGLTGVFVGFIIFGMILRRIDRAAARYLHEGQLMRFAKLYAVGIVMLDPLLRPFFIVNGALFAWIIMTVIDIALKGWLRGLRRRPAPQHRSLP